jgi:hypothetical protein
MFKVDARVFELVGYDIHYRIFGHKFELCVSYLDDYFYQSGIKNATCFV